MGLFRSGCYRKHTFLKQGVWRQKSTTVTTCIAPGVKANVKRKIDSPLIAVVTESILKIVQQRTLQKANTIDAKFKLSYVKTVTDEFIFFIFSVYRIVCKCRCMIVRLCFIILVYIRVMSNFQFIWTTKICHYLLWVKYLYKKYSAGKFGLSSRLLEYYRESLFNLNAIFAYNYL